jgi:LPXTG-motif cell wall-anchored protein
LSEKPRRFTSVTLLTLVVLFFAAFYLIRFFNALMQWNYLSGLLPFSPVYLVFTGLVWGVAGLVLVWCLWLGKSWTRWLFWLVFLAYAAWFWLDRWLMPGDLSRNANWLFWLGFDLLFTLASLWILYRKKAVFFFGRSH